MHAYIYKQFQDDLDGLLDRFRLEVTQAAGLDETKWKRAKERAASPAYVLACAGVMKAGKSAVLNALLGEDLLPSEQAACTLAATELLIGEERRIRKVYIDGSEEELPGAEAFLEDTRLSRRYRAVDFTYEVTHLLYAYPNAVLDSGRLVLLDLPGLNEADGLGVEKDSLEAIFQTGITQADSLLYIVDIQSYKSEENREVLDCVRQTRPDLLRHVHVVVNKIDQLDQKDGEIADLLADISETLRAFGLDNHTLYPVSAKKALLGRLLESGMEERYEEEISRFLPEKQVEIGGRLLRVRCEGKEAAAVLIEESGISALEDQVLRPLVENFSSCLEENEFLLLKEGAADLITQMDARIEAIESQCLKVEDKISEKEQLQQNILRLIEDLKLLHEEGIHKLDVCAAEWKKGEVLPEAPMLHSMAEPLREDSFRSKEAALEAACTRVNGWLEKESGQMLKSLSRFLNYQDEPYIQSLYTLVRTTVEQANAYIRRLALPCKQLNLDEYIWAELPEWEPVPLVLHYDRFLAEKAVEDYDENVVQSRFIFFTESITLKRWRYNLKGAAAVFEKQAAREAAAWWNKNIYTYQYAKYQRFLDEIKRAVSSRFVEALAVLRPLIEEIRTELRTLKFNCTLLEGEADVMKSIRSRISGRAGLMLKHQVVCVEEPGSLDCLIEEVEDGTLIRLGQGIYEIKEPHTLMNSVGIEGCGEDTVLVLKHSLESTRDRSILLKDLVVKLEGGTLIAGGYYAEIKDCLFFGRGSDALTLHNPVRADIRRSSFLKAACAVTIYTHQRVNVSDCRFNENNTGASVQKSAAPQLENCTFTGNREAGVIYRDEASGSLRRAIVETSLLSGIVVSDAAFPVLENNEIRHNSEAGIYYKGTASGTLSQNKIWGNGTGFRAEDEACAELMENECSNNSIGLELSSKAVQTLRENRVTSNIRSGLLCGEGTKADIYRNIIEENGMDGVRLDQSSRIVLKDNKISRNGGSGINAMKPRIVLLEGNHLSENKQSGMQAEQLNCLEASGNRIECNGRYGLNLVNTKSGTITENALLYNGKLPFCLEGKQAAGIRFNTAKSGRLPLKQWPAYLRMIWRISRSNQNKKKAEKSEQTKNRRNVQTRSRTAGKRRSR